MDLTRYPVLLTCVSEPGQPNADRSLAPSSLESILAAAPIGLDLSTGEGRRLFSGKGLQAGSRSTTNHRYDFAVGDQTFCLSLSLDDSERKQREEELLRRAYFDDLTGLPNRSLFEQSVRALIGSEPDDFALAFIDIDGFKRVNDYYGHAIGDLLLSRIAERLGTGLSPSYS